jgi:hypothetical protein
LPMLCTIFCTVRQALLLSSIPCLKNCVDMFVD